MAASSLAHMHASLTMRRVRLLFIDPTVMVGLLSLDGTKRVRIEGLPVDARIVSVFQLPTHNQIAFVVESEEFSEVPGDCMPPALRLNVTEIYDGTTR